MSDLTAKDPVVGVTFNRPKLEAFKQSYRVAVRKGADTVFEFEGNRYLVAYAKYMIQYLEERLA